MWFSLFRGFRSALNARAGLRTAMVLLSVVGILTLIVALQIFKITENVGALQIAMERSIEQRTQVRKMFSLIKDADLSYTRYLLTERNSDLQAFDALQEQMERESEALLTVLVGSDAQLERGKWLSDFSRRFFDQLKSGTIQVGQLQSIDDVLNFGSTKVRDVVDKMVAYEEQEIKRAQQNIYDQTRRSRTVSIVTLGGVALLVAVVLIYGLLYLSNRSRVELVLREANRLAEEANEAKTDFLATMSHEIRTPLTGVLGFTELLMNEKLTGRQEELAERIQTAGANLSAIVNDILDFSKIEAGQVVLDPRAFSLTELVENVKSIVWVTADSKNLDLRTEIDANVPGAVIGDEPRLRQILLNLLSNAVKFTHEGHVHLTVLHQGTSDAGESLRFEVKDTGIGFGPEKRDQLFTRFSQLDASTRREFGGTGLGLAISRELIELMGGEIGAESVKGVGTKFWITLRMPRGAENTLPSDKKDTVAAQAVGRILLAEDSKQNQDLITKVLRSAGHTVDIAGDGLEAVAAVQEGHYDIVLMDVQMPKMDGPAATREIRKLEHPANRVPIIALTANVLPQQVGNFRKAGMNDFIAKPFQRVDLLSKVTGWILAGSSDYADVGTTEAANSGNVTHDAQTLTDIKNLMGEEWVRKALRKLRTETADTFRDDALKVVDEMELKQRTHKIVSHAAQLGFFELSRTSSELENLCMKGRNMRPAIAAAQKASRLAARKMDELLAAAALA